MARRAAEPSNQPANLTPAVALLPTAKPAVNYTFSLNAMLTFTPETKLNNDNPLTAQLTALIDTAMVAKREADYLKNRGSGVGAVAAKRIGSGYIGVECGRDLAYRYHKAPKEERDGPVSKGELQRHAEVGFWTETNMAEWLRDAGFDLRTHNDDGRQFGYLACKDAQGQARMAGEIDGIILSGPAVLAYPLLWESKKATAKKFAKFVKEGVKKADAKYYGQLQNNHVMMDVPTTLFSMLNVDTMKFYFEVVAFDAPVAQALQDRAVKVLQSNTPEEIPRITNDPTDFRCKFCDFQRQCWSAGKAAAPQVFAVPAWAGGAK